MNRKLVVTLTCLTLALFTMPLMADGAATFKAKCAMCHGPDGAGQTPTGKVMKVRDLRTAEVQKMSDADLVKVVTDGKGKMPAYKGKLPDADITAVVGFIRTLKK
jgi:mono/diheme cytochrome c family protein